MQEFISEINYDKLISKHLRGVMVDALKIAAEQGLPGENHFYITFKTNVDGVKLPAVLKTQYPESMTIVLQHQFSDLIVDDDRFAVILVFGGVPQALTIPFSAITYFADPYAKFGLSFSSEEDERIEKLEDMEIKEEKNKFDTPAEVISIDRFRKNK